MSEEKPAPAGTSPLLLGAVGLALIFVGWQVSRWTPPAQSASALDELRRLDGDDEYRRKLDDYEAARPRPLELPGRLGLFVGLGLFVVAGVKMVRSPAPPPEPGPES